MSDGKKRSQVKEFRYRPNEQIKRDAEERPLFSSWPTAFNTTFSCRLDVSSLSAPSGTELLVSREFNGDVTVHWGNERVGHAEGNARTLLLEMLNGEARCYGVASAVLDTLPDSSGHFSFRLKPDGYDV